MQDLPEHQVMHIVAVAWQSTVSPMTLLDLYSEPFALPHSEASRIGMLLGLKASQQIDDIGLAERVSIGLHVDSAESLASLIGRIHVVGPLISEATLRRAKKNRKPLSRKMSERLYKFSRVLDAVSRTYHGDKAAIARFLEKPHQFLGGYSPLELARSSSAGVDAVINVLRKAESGIAV